MEEGETAGRKESERENVRLQNSYAVNFIETSKGIEMEFWNAATKMLIRKLNL